MFTSQRLHNFRCRSWADKSLLVKAYLLLGASRLAILTTDFKRIAERLGNYQDESPTEVPKAELELAQRVSWAVQSASRFTPWTSNCFPQAITAQYLLRQFGVSSTLNLGCLIDTEDQMKAHAWLRCGKRIVTGRLGHQTFGVVATFRSIPVATQGTA